MDVRLVIISKGDIMELITIIRNGGNVMVSFLFE